MCSRYKQTVADLDDRSEDDQLSNCQKVMCARIDISPTGGWTWADTVGVVIPILILLIGTHSPITETQTVLSRFHNQHEQCWRRKHHHPCLLFLQSLYSFFTSTGNTVRRLVAISFGLRFWSGGDPFWTRIRL